MSLSKLEHHISSLWNDLPVKLTLQEIQTSSQLCRWEDCGKDELHIGIIRHKNNDTVIIVTHQMRIDYTLLCRFEDIPASDLNVLGLVPIGPQLCAVCREFSTRINKDGRCHDCTQKKIYKFSDGKVTTTIWPNTGESGNLLMPLVRNVPNGREGWQIVNCPICGIKCWERPEQPELMKRPGMTSSCTMCGIKQQVGN